MKRNIFLGDHVLRCDIISFGAKDQFRIEMWTEMFLMFFLNIKPITSYSLRHYVHLLHFRYLGCVDTMPRYGNTINP